MQQSSWSPQSSPLDRWKPRLPDGTLRSIVLHWTAGDYVTTYGAYHFCLSGSAQVVVHATHDLQANMRNVAASSGAYAAHTAGRNSFAIGLAVCAMRAATPHDFAQYPVSADQIDALCSVAAVLVRHYGIPIAAVGTHAEAAVADGYFGAGDDDLRWDLARLQPSPEPLLFPEAGATGDRLRERIGLMLAGQTPCVALEQGGNR